MATTNRTKRPSHAGWRDDAKDLAGSALSNAADALVHSKRGILLIVVVALLLFGGLFDLVLNAGKAYSGVYVGSVDVGGLNAEQIEQKVAQEYEVRLPSAGVTVYANRTAADAKAVQETYGDEVDVQTERENRVSWSTSSEALQAYIDYEKLAREAIAVGRDNPADRLSLLFETKSIDVPVNFNEALVEALASDIDASIGKPLTNYDVAVEYGSAVVIPGEDGNMVDRAWFKSQLADQLLSPDAENRQFVAETVYTPVRIDQNAAQQVADSINSAIANGVTFTCNGTQWSPDDYTIGTWIQTVEEKHDDGSYKLVPTISTLKARESILENLPPKFEDGKGDVSFVREGDGISVRVSSEGTFPLVGDAIQSLNTAMFGSVSPDSSSNGIQIELSTAQVPPSMSFDEALSYGVITAVSEFTPLYTTGATARNVNIHLAADLVNDSIIKANGGQWSFNETAGECNEAKGFQAATAIAAGTTVDEIGGGICQIATTIFNSVYLGGYPIVERHNHTLYVASYPLGRDATVSWPEPDLKWRNDGTSDLLLRMSYTDDSVTAALYGVSMGYTVETEDGAWVDGQEPGTVYENDPTLPAGTEYVKVYGSSGHSTTVTRIVKDAEGTIVRNETFSSVYSAQDTVIVRGSASADALYGSGEY
ncbi:MAG: VanW family protein [Eggerthellaceae bacterium]|nr:VanW family protein [Eggerthellaceae bacterium]